MEIVYRLDPEAEVLRPESAARAKRELERGNERFASFHAGSSGADAREVITINPSALGITALEDTPPPQTPFAAVLGCADARVPVDLVFERAVNEIFVVRIAGNVLGDECLGSLDFAAKNLGTVQLFVVLGHTGCGAVSAAVDAFLTPSQYPTMASSQGLRSIVDRLFVSIRWASMALGQVVGPDVTSHPSYRDALIETSVAVNAALTAMTLKQEIERDVAFGVYDLVSRRVRVPRSGAVEESALEAPPADLRGLEELGRAAAGSDWVASMLAK